MDQIHYDKYLEINFHRVDYFLHVKANNQQLVIDVEQKNTADIWRNQFSAQSIEQLSQKTGNFKRYPVFIKMLISSINHSSQSVYIDILTQKILKSYHDLQLLNSKKNQSSSKYINNNKRYLILTYLVEFDKVHYPLVLNFVEQPTYERLKQTIKRLLLERKEGSYLGEPIEISGLQSQNIFLKQKIKKLQQVQQKINRHKNSENQHLQKLKIANQQIEKYKVQLEESRKLISNLQLQNKQNEQQLNKLELQVNKIPSYIHDKQKISNQRIFKENLKQIVKYKQIEKKLRQRIKQLQEELKSTLKKKNNSNQNQKKSFSPCIILQSVRRSKSSQKSQSLKNSESYNDLKNFRKKQKKIETPKRSVIDCQTESSRNRKSSNKNYSPYRNSSNISKKVQFIKKKVSQNRFQNRSKSKSKKSISPQKQDESIQTDKSIVIEDDSFNKQKNDIEKRVQKTLELINKQKKNKKLKKKKEQIKIHYQKKKDQLSQSYNFHEKINNLQNLIKSVMNNNK